MAPDIDDLKAVWLDLRAHVEELASEREQYLDLFERSAEAYVITAPDATIREANGAAVDVLQRRKRHLFGKPLTALVALEKRGDFRNRLIAVRAGKAAQWSTIIESPGLRTEVKVAARPIGVPPGVRGICWRLEALR